MVSEYRIPHQVYDNREEDVLRFGNYKDVVERVVTIPVDVFNTSIDDRVVEQFVDRNGGNIGPYVDNVSGNCQHIAHRRRKCCLELGRVEWSCLHWVA